MQNYLTEFIVLFHCLWRVLGHQLLRPTPKLILLRRGKLMMMVVKKKRSTILNTLLCDVLNN